MILVREQKINCWINESKFYNNTAQISGGHIGLSLNSDLIKGSWNITVNNSHFKNRSASGSGGGLIL